MTLFRNFFSCVRGHRSHTHRRVSSSQAKIKFGESLQSFCKKECHLPRPIFGLITFLAHEGVQTTDLFRRPGNINHMNVIIKLLAQGKPVQWTEYNLYTCANVAKKYLLNLPGGLFGRKGESILLATFDWSEEARITEFLDLLRHMILATQELTILIFGILFRMVTYSINAHQTMSHNTPTESSQNLSQPLDFIGTPLVQCSRSVTEQSIDSLNIVNRQTMLTEAVAKSVAGSLFHTCRDSPEKVERAAKVLEHLILSFPSFDDEFLDFFDHAMNGMTNSMSSTISSHDISRRDSSKIVRKPSGLAASFEMWSESFGKGTSQRSSLTDSKRNRFERVESEVIRISHIHFHNVPTTIPSITITNPYGEVNLHDSLAYDAPIIERDIVAKKMSDVDSFRHFQLRVQSMKRRHQANLKKRSDWFLNNSPSPTTPISPSERLDNSFVVVTCGGSSICLGQSEQIASGNQCLTMLPNHSSLLANYFASSGPDILQTTPGNTRPGTPNYSMMSQVSSTYNSNTHVYDATDLNNNGTLSSDIDRHIVADVEAPNSVPLIRRLLSSRSSTTSRKASVQQECMGHSFHSAGQDEEEEDDDDEFVIDDTQSDCY